MNILKKMQQVLRRLTIREPDGWAPIGMAGDSGEFVGGDAALGLSAVWACVNLICGTAASLPLMVYREGQGGRVVAKDHPLYRLLHDSPNYDQTATDFWEFMFASVELWGNAYAVKVRNGLGGIVALEPVSPDGVTVRRTAEGALEYRYSHNGRSLVTGDADMLHIRGFGGNPLGGLSTLQFARNTFSLARSIEKSAGKMFANGLRPSGILTFKDWLSADKRETAEKVLTEKFAGSVNSGRPMVLEGGTEWKALSFNPDDAQMLQSRSFSVEEICRFFGTPPFMVGHTEKSSSWGTGLAEQTLGFQKFTLRRRLKRIEQALEKQLLTPEDRSRGLVIEFNLEGLLRGDSASRAQFYDSGLRSGWLVINEVRALENLPPVAGGDVPRMQSQNIPITEAGKTALPPA